MLALRCNRHLWNTYVKDLQPTMSTRPRSPIRTWQCCHRYGPRTCKVQLVRYRTIRTARQYDHWGHICRRTAHDREINGLTRSRGSRRNQGIVTYREDLTLDVNTDITEQGVRSRRTFGLRLAQRTAQPERDATWSKVRIVDDAQRGLADIGLAYLKAIGQCVQWTVVLSIQNENCSLSLNHKKL